MPAVTQRIAPSAARPSATFQFTVGLQSVRDNLDFEYDYRTLTRVSLDNLARSYVHKYPFSLADTLKASVLAMVTHWISVIRAQLRRIFSTVNQCTRARNSLGRARASNIAMREPP